MIDYDTDGADEADLYGIPQADGSISDAYVSGGSVSAATITLSGIKPALATARGEARSYPRNEDQEGKADA